MVSVVTLALGIGANTFVFTVINSLLLAPFPVERPDEVVFVQGGPGIGQSFPNYRDIRDGNTTLAGVIGYRIAPMNVEWSAGPQRAWGYLATDNYFDVLGVRPAVGRFFEEAMERDAMPVAVLSYDAWRARFAGDPAIVGQTIRINRHPFTVIGVAPRGFHGLEHVFHAELWVPMLTQPLVEPGRTWLESRRAFNVWLAARLKPEVSPSAVRADLDRLATYLARTYPTANEGLTFTLARPGLIGDLLRTPFQAFTWGVLALAGLVLLTGCVNLSSLLVARSADRQREIAVRISLGATRAHVIRQFLTEAWLLATAGGVCGAFLAAIGARALSRWYLMADPPIRLTVEPDFRVGLFAILMAACAGLLFGLAPGWQSMRTDPNDALRGHTHSWGNRRWQLRDLLLVVQVSICVVLLTACFLSIRGLRQALVMPIGFESTGVTMASFELALAGYSTTEGRVFQQRIINDVRGQPGVEQAAYASSIPLFTDHSINTVFAEDQPIDEPGHQAAYYSVSASFFETMRIPLLRGRDFSARDHQDSPRVAIVNEAFMRQVLHADEAVGRRFKYTRTGPLIEIIGVVGDGKYQTLTESPRPALFEPISQSPFLTAILVARSSLPSETMTAMLRSVFAQHDAGLSLYNLGPVEDTIAITLLPNRVAAWALSGFGLLALLLATTGIHGMVAYALARRRREIAIHIALGAYRGDVLRLILSRMMRVLAVGIAAGLVLAAVIGPLLSQVVYLTSPRDPSILASAPIALGVVGVLACVRPALAAMRVEPIVALRTD
jgi:predicted permease